MNKQLSARSREWAQTLVTEADERRRGEVLHQAALLAQYPELRDRYLAIMAARAAS